MIVINPFGTKEELFNTANELVSEFLTINPQIPKPTICINNKMCMYGQAKGKIVMVNLQRCRTSVRVPGYSWSFSGYKADLTPIGVLTHEMGHVAHNFIGKQYSAPVTKLRKLEPQVSSYEPNCSETIAESTKLFISNPNLLKLGRPLRFKFLIEFMEMTPVHDTPWEEVLQLAHPKLINAAKKWVSAGQSTSKKYDNLFSF